MERQEESDQQKDAGQPNKRSRSNSDVSSAESDEATKRQRVADTRFETLISQITSSSKMSTIALEGNSLSVRQQKLNAAVDEAYKNEIPLAEVLSSGEQTDIDNIYKIDLASKYRNVDYIIENLKSTDSLLVTRALKAHWLFTDNEYSHVINPTYVDSTLQPLTSDKAYIKFMNKLTCHLNDEERCEEFYMHYLQMKDKQYMKKFLLSCSVDFIKTRIANKDFDISPECLSLLSRKSYEIVAVYVETQAENKVSLKHLKELRHLVEKHGNFYLDLLEESVVDDYSHFRLGQRVTREIIRNHKQRIFKRPHLYLNLLHFKQLLHALTLNDISHLASLVTSQNKFWGNDLLKTLLNLLPNENRYKFIKSLFVRDHPGEAFEMNRLFTSYRWYEYMSQEQREEWALQHIAQRDEDLGKFYQWYKFVDFGKTFVELKELLRAEPNASERESMFQILVSTCDDDESNITKLLKYFHDRHINETIHFKLHIIGRVMEMKDIYQCGDEVWNILTEILLSMRIYEDVNDCSYHFKKSTVAQVMVHHIINDKPITEKMFKLYETHYTPLSMMITTPWKGKLFEFLYQWIFAKVDGLDLQDPHRLKYAINWMREFISLYRSWGYKPKPEFIMLINKIHKHDSKCFEYLLYDTVYKEYFPKEDRLPTPPPKLTEATCLQNLKKDITLLDGCKEQFNENIKNNTMRYKKFLSKIRIYFGKDLAPKWRKYFFEKFKENHKDPKGCACVVFGLATLLPANEFEKLVKEYMPANAKLVWSETDPCLVHIQTNIAKFMYLVRPVVNHEYLKSYAKGDFLQHSVRSLLSLSRQLPRDKCRELIVKLLASPVSVQKHGIRLACNKYSMDELVDIFGKMWVKTKNVSIRKLLFSYIHDLLTQAEEDAKRFDIWKLLSMLLTQLHGNEFLANIVDPARRRVQDVGISVRAQYCTAYWHLLQTVQDCEQIWAYRVTIMEEMSCENLINLLDEDFLNHVILNFIDKYFNQVENDTKNLPYRYVESVWQLIATFVVYCETKDIAEHRKDVFHKIIGNILVKWDKNNAAKSNFYQFFKDLLCHAQTVLYIEHNYYSPIHLFEYIRDEISEKLPQKKYYDHRLWSKFTVTLIKSLHETRPFKPESFVAQGELWAEIFGEHCVELMKSETAENYPRLPQIFRHHFMKFIDHGAHGQYGYNRMRFYIGVSKSFLKERADLDCCILAVECLVKVHSNPDKIEAASMLDSIRAMDVPELNLFIEAKVGAPGNPFK